MDLLDLTTIQTMIVFGSGLIVGVIFGMMILSCIQIGKDIKWGDREYKHLIWEEDEKHDKEAL